MKKQPTLFDLTTLDGVPLVATQEVIRQYNTHRFEMEMLSAIAYEDDDFLCVAYQDVADDAFWCRGHMPGFPLMPGVLICEAAAQLASYYAMRRGYLPYGVVGLGGLENVKFRGIVRPGDRLYLIDKIEKLRHSMMIVHFEAAIQNELVAEGQIKGVAIRTDDPSENP